MKITIFVLLFVYLQSDIYASDNKIHFSMNDDYSESIFDGSIFHIDDSLLIVTWPNAGVKPITRFVNRDPFSHNLRLHFTPDNASLPYYLIIVRNSLYNSLSYEIKTYAEDAHAIYGYGIYVETVQYPTPEDVKSLIISYSNNLCGVFFIGDVSECFYEISNDYGKYGYRNWPCDLYYMDLDGIWTDSDSNGIYDEHSGNVAPDIFLGRLSTVGLSSLGNEVDLIRRQLKKSHDYWWKSSDHTSNTVLNYIDYDWNDMFYAYDISPVFSSGNVTDIRYYDPSYFISNFSVPDYLSRISNITYGFTHLSAHSSPVYHEFTNGYIHTSDIIGINSYNYAYNLFCCSACNWAINTYSEYLGGVYLFNNGKTMSVVGSTKTGGMQKTEKFYSQLPSNNIGKAFLNWWNNAYGNNHNTNAISWSYGMTILGDPIMDFRYEVSNKCVNNLVLTNYPNNNSSNMILFKAGNKITVSNNFIIPQGVHVIFDAPIVVFDNNFSCPLGASIETRNEGCEL